MDEEVFGFSLADAADDSVKPLMVAYVAGESARYPVQPHVYYKASSDFFQATKSGPFRLTPPERVTAVTSKGTKDDFRRLHEDPSFQYVEHEWGTWATISHKSTRPFALSVTVEQRLQWDAGSGPHSVKIRREIPLALSQHWLQITHHWERCGVKLAHLRAREDHTSSFGSNRARRTTVQHIHEPVQGKGKGETTGMRRSARESAADKDQNWRRS